MHRWWIALLVGLAASVALAQDFSLPFEGDVLAFTSGEGGLITLYDTQTTLWRDLSFGAGAHHVWDFSPDGCRVLFTLTEDAAPTRVYSARLDGTDRRDLLDLSDLPDSDWTVWQPDWSARDIIALTLARNTIEGRESRVAWIPGEGGPPTFYSVAGDEHDPVWSPSGDWLAYTSYEQRPAGPEVYATADPNNTPPDAPQLREADIWLVTANGLTKERITTFTVGSAAHPRWSPDETLLGFVFSPSAGENQFWMIAAAPGAIPTQLSFEWNQTLDVVWHPQGTSMVAAVRDFQGADESRLWTIPLQGNADIGATRYFSDPTLAGTHADYPRFNATGDLLAFRSGYQLQIVNTVTGERVALDNYASTPPVWSPAGFQGEAACG